MNQRKWLNEPFRKVKVVKISNRRRIIQDEKQLCFSSLDSSVKFSHSVLSDSLWLHGLQNARLPSVQFSSVQSLICVWLFATPWIAARQASLSITISQSSPKLMTIKSVMPSSHLILCRPLLLLSPIPPSIRVFSSESTLCMWWPKYWSFSFSISTSKQIPGLISFRID